MQGIVRRIALIFMVVACGVTLAGQSAVKSEDPAAQLAAALKPILAGSMPETLYEKSDNWGHTVNVPVGLKWRGLRPRIAESPREHGEWKKLIITAQELKRSLDLKIADVKTVDKERDTFKVLLTFQMGVYYEQQNWESGVRLWSGSIRARAQVHLELNCESTLKVDFDKNFLPDFTVRLRVTDAKVGYDKLVFEHLNGLGGDAAKILGDAVHGAMKRWKPSIERDLLDKASKAIIRTADTKEIKIGLGNLIKKK